MKQKWIQLAGLHGRLRAWAIAVLVLINLLLAGCGMPVPADKAQYVGQWHAESMYLFISADGRVEYNRRSGNGHVSINGPIQRFTGNNFDVGLGPFSTTFVVSRPPWKDDGQWKMVVDGVELVRQPAAGLISY